MNGQQGGGPTKLADALVTVDARPQLPMRWPAGADAVETFGPKANELLAQAEAHRDLSSNLAHDD
jgi:hypothetical protein